MADELKVTRRTWLAIVQDGDEPYDQETEAATIEFVDGEPRVIETTDGRRITLMEPVAG